MMVEKERGAESRREIGKGRGGEMIRSRKASRGSGKETVLLKSDFNL